MLNYEIYIIIYFVMFRRLIFFCLISFFACHFVGANIEEKVFENFFIGTQTINPPCVIHNTAIRFCRGFDQCISTICEVNREFGLFMLFQPMNPVTDCKNSSAIFDAAMIMPLSSNNCSTSYSTRCFNRHDCVNQICQFHVKNKGNFLDVGSASMLSHC